MSCCVGQEGMPLLPGLSPSTRIGAGRGWGQRGKERRRQRRGSQDRTSFIQERTQGSGPAEREEERPENRRWHGRGGKQAGRDREGGIKERQRDGERKRQRQRQEREKDRYGKRNAERRKIRWRGRQTHGRNIRDEKIRLRETEMEKDREMKGDRKLARKMERHKGRERNRWKETERER